MAEHLGLLDGSGKCPANIPHLQDASSQLTWDFLSDSAECNSSIFDKVN